MEMKPVRLTGHDIALLERIKAGDHPYFDRNKVEPLIDGGFARLAEFGRVVITKSGSQFLASQNAPIEG